jgi:hypothetical protein
MTRLFNIFNIVWDSSQSEDDEWLFEMEHPSSINAYELEVGYDEKESIKESLWEEYDAAPIDLEFEEVDYGD